MKTRPPLWAAALLALIVLSAGVGFAQSSRATLKLTADFAVAFDKEDWPKAIELGERLVEASPKNHVHPYNLACAHARSGNVDEALTWLERSAEQGFSNPKGVREDDDLASLREEAGYTRAVEKIQANYQLARSLFEDMAQGSEAIIVAPPQATPLPVLLLLHGYGDRPEAFTEVFKGFSQRQGLLLVGVRSVVPVAGRPPGQGFEWATPVDAMLQIQSALDQAAAQHPIDRQRIYLLGFSQGGRMALEAALQEEAPYRGVIVVGAPVRKGLPEELPVDAPPIFLMVGGNDDAATSARKGAKALRKADHPVELRVYPGVGHAFPRTWEAEIRSAIRWFESFD